MVVSNLRHFTLKIGVIDRSGGGHEAELPLKAELLYENGQLVEQLATCVARGTLSTLGHTLVAV